MHAISGFDLVVTSDFEQYARGARITDDHEVARVKAEHPDKVVQVPPQSPRPVKAAKSSKAAH